MKFLRIFLVALGTLFVLLAGAAHFVDPRGDFAGHRFPRVTLDSRTEKMDLFHAYAASGQVDGLVLGSSRSMTLDPKELGARLATRFFNFSVDNARAEDYLAIYRWARQHDSTFRYVVIGLDVEALHDDDLLDPRLVANRALLAELDIETRRSNVLGRIAGIVRQYREIYTAAYLADMARSVDRYLRPTAHAAQAVDFDADGLLRYRRLERERAAGTFDLDRQISDGLPGYVARFRGMRDLSARRKEELEQLIRECRAAGATVKIWLTALHPVTAQHLDQTTPYGTMLSRTRAYLTDLRARYGIDVYDYSEPRRFGGSLTGWYDGAHIDEANAHLVAVGLTGPSDNVKRP